MRSLDPVGFSKRSLNASVYGRLVLDEATGPLLMECYRELSGPVRMGALQECSVRVYCRRSDKESVKALKEAADSYLKQHYGGGIQCSTPVRKSLQADWRENRDRDPTRKRQLFPVDEEVDPPAKVLRT